MSAQYMRPYWVHRVTRETVWQDPRGRPLDPAQEWEERMSEQYGRPYWVHRLTKESTWTDPYGEETSPEKAKLLAESNLRMRRGALRRQEILDARAARQKFALPLNSIHNLKPDAALFREAPGFAPIPTERIGTPGFRAQLPAC